MKRKVERQINALNRLKDQLKSGVKTEKRSMGNKIPITDLDKIRVQKEISVLEERIKEARF